MSECQFRVKSRDARWCLGSNRLFVEREPRCKNANGVKEGEVQRYEGQLWVSEEEEKTARGRTRLP